MTYYHIIQRSCKQRWQNDQTSAGKVDENNNEKTKQKQKNKKCLKHTHDQENWCYQYTDVSTVYVKGKTI